LERGEEIHVDKTELFILWDNSSAVWIILFDSSLAGTRQSTKVLNHSKLRICCQIVKNYGNTKINEYFTLTTLGENAKSIHSYLET